jgi:hypothetical protein
VRRFVAFLHAGKESPVLNERTAFAIAVRTRETAGVEALPDRSCVPEQEAAHYRQRGINAARDDRKQPKAQRHRIRQLRAKRSRTHPWKSRRFLGLVGLRRLSGVQRTTRDASCPAAFWLPRRQKDEARLAPGFEYFAGAKISRGRASAPAPVPARERSPGNHRDRWPDQLRNPGTCRCSC